MEFIIFDNDYNINFKIFIFMLLLSSSNDSDNFRTFKPKLNNRAIQTGFNKNRIFLIY